MLGRLAERYGSARHEMRGGSLGMGVGSHRRPRPTAVVGPSRNEEGWLRSDFVATHKSDTTRASLVLLSVWALWSNRYCPPSSTR